MSTTNDAERISEICKILSKEIPNPESELNYKSPYTFLLAVIMSAQTTDVQVNKVTETLFEHYDTIDKILALGENGLAEKISSIGLYRNKARNIIALSKVLQDQYNGEVPLTREDLEKLPGVGRKSANVVLNTLCGLPTIAVDTHVLRLSKRLGFSQHNDPSQITINTQSAISWCYMADTFAKHVPRTATNAPLKIFVQIVKRENANQPSIAFYYKHNIM